jgi:phosphinothricin acetyltransferase
MRIIDCDTSHLPMILEILNEAILNSTALYDYKPRTMDMMREWWGNKLKGRYPVIAAVEDLTQEQGGTTPAFLGFASYGPFRQFPAYKYTVEHSLYVHKNHRGRGVGQFLLQSIIARARDQDYHVVVGGIDSGNTASIALHQKFGFELVATMPEVGFKFGRWLDLCFYQLLMDTPAQPVER